MLIFPFDFGMIPGTKGEDGDPLDALVISEHKTFPGCRVRCRLIGLLQAMQTEKTRTIRNDRYFFIPENSLVYRQVRDISDLPGELVEQLIFFFVAYNKVEGKKFQPEKVIRLKKASLLLSRGKN
ncbi:inorganic diphosphatase [Flavihumibacter petaseus]|uniref:inorganic diphosphatase n=1 Tax=Flavihumibacter petaseus NBRC 106054 TaxID=1220578 RepID=A0A0E9N3S9_9BACT|nr:inorganic diphosphatase [Flavihumibacter petaseus]GAO44015.1 putative inorganic pyrophosphatase [Flavihumibacter petaseus NBRC 106054]